MSRESHTEQRGNTRQRLIDTMLELIWSSSYGAVSVDDICKAAGAQKGSFYHFFESKADLTVATFEHQWEQCRTELDEIFSPSRPALQRFVRYLDEMLEEQKEKRKEFGYVVGCPFCSIGSELATQDEKVRIRIEKIFEHHLRYFENALRDAVAEGSLPKKTDVKAKARELDTLMMGAILNARITNSLEPIGKELSRAVFNCLQVSAPSKKAA